MIKKIQIIIHAENDSKRKGFRLWELVDKNMFGEQLTRATRKKVKESSNSKI